MPTEKFFISRLREVASGIWVVVIGLAGYAFGHLMELILADLRKYELWIVLGLFVIGSAAGVYRWLKRRREQQPAEI